MARSLHSIEMDFSKAKRQASDLERIANNLRTISDRQMEDTLRTLEHNWLGDNSVKYMGKGRQLEGKIRETSKSLENIAGAIREIAQNVYEAEMRAWEIAHNRD